MAAIQRASGLALLGGLPTTLQQLQLDSSWLVLIGLASLFTGAAVWWFRERSMASLRQSTRLLNHLAEEVIASVVPQDVLTKLNATLPKIWEQMIVALYLYNKGTKSLEMVTTSATAPVSIRPDGPLGGIASGIALCFRNRTLLIVPDTRRSPFFNEQEKKHLPRSLMFVPMFAQNDLIGVMQAHHEQNLHNFSEEEQTALQHLANQVAAALRLQEQKSIRERLYRTEKLAAAGQLISGIAGELRSPLGSILEMTGGLKSRRSGAKDQELDLIEAEALRASEIVSRLVAFGQADHTEAQPVDIHALLSRLLRLRGNERKRRGLEIHPNFLNQRILVLGSQAQLEQVFLNLLVQAESAAAEAADIAMSISTSLLARRILIEIGYHTDLSDVRKDPFENGADGASLGLGLCRGIIQSHGGDIRFVRVSPAQSRFEVELPVIETPQFRASQSTESRIAQRHLTVLLVEPDAKSSKQILEVLSKRGDRVVPVGSAEEAADLAQRLRFDLTLCAVRLPGLNWIEFFERVRRHVGSFVLLTQGYDPDLAKAFQNGEGYVLSKPVDEQQLNRICDVAGEKASGLAGAG